MSKPSSTHSFNPNTPDATERTFLYDAPHTPSSPVFSHHPSLLSHRSSIPRPLPVPPAPPGTREVEATPDTGRTPETNDTDCSSIASISPVGISAIASPPDYKAPDPRGEERLFDPTRLYSNPSSSVVKNESPLNDRPTSSRRNPISTAYEPPEWPLVVLHIGLCMIAYPVLMIFTLIAREKTLFWTRFVVSCGCGIVGFCLGLSLLNLARAFLEAATWATLIHQSRMPEAPGLTLRDFAAASQGASALTAARVLWNRTMYPGTARRQRKEYDPRPWSLYVVYFLFLILLAASLPFILGRLVQIDASIQHQNTDYREVAIKGDLSDVDIGHAKELQAIFEEPVLTWTLSHFTRGVPPLPVSFPWGSDEVYFAETSSSQLLPGGAGFGIYTHKHAGEESNSTGNVDDSSSVFPTDVETGTTLRYPRWGIRMHCKKIPNADRNIIPKSAQNFTYLFSPLDTMADLFTSFSLQFPKVLDKPLNMTLAIRPNDTLPIDIDPNSLTLGVAFYDNGVSHSYFSSPINMGEDGGGFVSLEVVLIRLNTTYTPSGKFPVYSRDSLPDASGNQTRIGYDGAICLELFEPWIVETYNSTTGVPASTRIINKASTVTDLLSGEKNVGDSISGVKRQLNSSALWPAYVVAHQNSVNQMVKDNSRDAFYVPSPMVISYSTGEGPRGYTELTEASFVQARSRTDASNMLPYFAGTGDIVARSYSDLVLSNARILTVPMVILLVLVLVFGLLAGLFVPKLPLGVPRRDFELYSWVAAFHGDEVSAEMHRAGVERNMELKEIDKRLGNMKFRYVF